MGKQPIVIVAGQSNATMPPLPIAVSQQLAEMGAIVVHYAVSGSALSAHRYYQDNDDWDPSGEPGAGELLDDLYARVDSIVDPGKPGHIEGAHVAGMIWVQGEADAGLSETAADYKANLKLLHADVTARYGAHDMVVSLLSEDVSAERREGLWQDSAEQENGWATVRQAQMAVAAKDASVLSVDPDTVAAGQGFTVEDMFQDDRIHYEPDFAALLGQELASTLSVSGDADIQVGTQGNDWFKVSARAPVQQMLGFTQYDTADFSNLRHGVWVKNYLGEMAVAHERGNATELTVSMVSVEAAKGTSYADVFVLGRQMHTVDASGGADKVIGWGRGRDVIDLGAGDDVASGRGGRDIIHGENGRDVLRGNGGADRLFGDAGRDKLVGGAGRDKLVGGAGNDELRPGGGEDRIIWRPNESGTDRVIGFEQGDDLLVFQDRNVDFGDLEFDAGRSNLRIHIDAGGMDLTVVLVGGADLTLTEDDFLF
ncbi:sialate O-acetylesterase [Tropicimonas isoalkanivorans]|uniref:Hemolysin-type calcium-binding repeat-containing protein n=1 Tax=Tropicimonas isoalkanivorans TaxID=441112 RepID=A0A1I1EIG2_9RHOB|nr:sialate O-acetylesterase [Tropicimonas isoalkanivorans]SFB84790.1 Hemolysin-type calcium-binding repeat-containing protein [Tropicimonas isoalkanivorans]